MPSRKPKKSAKQPHKFTYLKFEKVREQSQYTTQRYFMTTYRLKPIKVRIEPEQMDQHILAFNSQDMADQIHQQFNALPQVDRIYNQVSLNPISNPIYRLFELVYGAHLPEGKLTIDLTRSESDYFELFNEFMQKLDMTNIAIDDFKTNHPALKLDCEHLDKYRP